MHADYTIAPIELTDRMMGEYANLLRTVFPLASHITRDYLHWEYIQNPYGKAFGYDAFYKGSLAAHFVVQPLEACCQGMMLRGVLSLNAATHPEHRKKGLYFDLGKHAYEDAKDRGYDFGICVTNDQSTGGFVKSLSFDNVTPLDVKVGLGMVPAQSQSGEFSGFRKRWTKEGLLWRLSCPTIPYKAKRYPGGLQFLGPAQKLGFSVFMGSTNEVGLEYDSRYREGINPLRLWVGKDPDINWAGSAFVDLPKRLRPSPLNLLYKNLSTALPVLEKASVRWSAMDFDTF